MQTDVRDRELVARIARRDSAALRALYMTHSVRVYRFVLRLARNETLAEDVVSETFLKVWQKAASYGGQARVSTWLLSIARNEAISVLRKKTEAPLDDDAGFEQEDESDTQDVLTAKKDKGVVMRKCIDKLSDAHREIIDLVYYQDCSVAEIAKMLDIPENTVKTRMFHARKQLSEHFRRAGIDRGWP
ncbi:MAG: sigma-70 family RNA polymerase sigma factor [Alphaproteobacteria bacterium]|nr:sigma-70 family RNA polymerase sigma factor [Alphaproteobacteria bacterium]